MRYRHYRSGGASAFARRTFYNAVALSFIGAVLITALAAILDSTEQSAAAEWLFICGVGLNGIVVGLSAFR